MDHISETSAIEFESQMLDGTGLAEFLQVEPVGTFAVLGEVRYGHRSESLGRVGSGDLYIRLHGSRLPARGKLHRFVLFGNEFGDPIGQLIGRHGHHQTAWGQWIGVGTESVHDEFDLLTGVQACHHDVGVAGKTTCVVEQPEFASETIREKRIGVDAFGDHAIVQSGHHQNRCIVERDVEPTEHFDGSVIGKGRNLDTLKLLLQPSEGFGKFDLKIQLRWNIR